MPSEAKIRRRGAKRLRRIATRSAGRVIRAISPQCRFQDCIFIPAHMRCGPTPLSNNYCLRPDSSVYGEPQIRPDSPNALGLLVVNQALRREWAPGAPHLFAKILQSRYDREPDPDFSEGRAVFVARRPVPTTRLIRKLYTVLERDECWTDRTAAEYYIERFGTLVDHWGQFDANRRVGLTFDALIADPDVALAMISSRLGLEPPLENRYESPPTSLLAGAGDPIAAGRYTRIEPRATDPSTENDASLDLPARLLRAAEEAYARYVETIAPPS